MLRERLIAALGSDGVKTEPEDLAVYSFDAYTDGGRPAAVVLSKSHATAANRSSRAAPGPGSVEAPSLPLEV